MAIDGTKKWPEEGYKREWPEVCRMTPAMNAQVDARWAELGLDAAWKQGERGEKEKKPPSEAPASLTDSILRAARTVMGGRA